MKTFAILIATVLITISFLTIGCTDATNTKRVLSAQGFTNIQTTGYEFFGCDGKDWKHTGFIATAPNGSRVKGVVCQGLLFKGATVRFK